VDLAAILVETRIGRRYAAVARRSGVPLPEVASLARALHDLRPDERSPTADRLFIAVGAHDRIALSRGALALATAWGVTPFVYPRGHLTLLFACEALRRDLARFVSGGPRDQASMKEDGARILVALPG
jgi:hypothetical protein